MTSSLGDSEIGELVLRYTNPRRQRHGTDPVF